MTRRRVGFFLIFGALVPLAVAATAWACGVLATLKTSSSVAAPGQTLTVTGVNYQPNNGVTSTNPAPTFTPVQIRWNSRAGAVLKEVTPDAEGKINTTIEVPQVPPDWYVLNGTQFRLSDGTPKSGTPGRVTLRVQGAAAGAASAWDKTPAGPGGTAIKVDAGPGSPATLPTLLAIGLSLALLGSGLTLVRRSRTRSASQPLLGA